MRSIGNNLLDMEHRVGGPAFRWNLAQRFAASGRISRPWQVDKQVEQATSYLRAWQRAGRDHADAKHPIIAAACAVVENDQSLQLLKLSILGSLPRAEVAARLSVEQQVVDVAEALFLDITDLSQASGWMNSHVFVPEAKFGSKELAAKMKLAHYGGPVIARALLDGHERLPLKEAQQIIDQELLLHAKLQAALEFDLDTDTAQQFLEVFLKYDLERRKLEFEREKFQFECALVREQRTNDQADRADSSIDTASGRQDIQDDKDEQVQRSVIDPTDDKQLVA